MRKFPTSVRRLAALAVIITFCQASFSQIETNAVPARWEYYSGKDKKVSFLMPRLPVHVESGALCNGESTETYAAYTDGVVFRVDITSKVDPPALCRQNKKDFDEGNFKKRLTDLKPGLSEEPNTGNNISGDSVIKLSGENKIIKLVNDYAHKRWFELSVYGADENKPEVKNFLASLKTDVQPTGIPIGSGATQAFGDEVAAADAKLMHNILDNDGKKTEDTSTEITLKIKDTATKGAVVVLKQRAAYTDAARQNKVQGKVLLRVTLMANGAIGKIYVLRGLENGLTDEAVKAARKLVFIPQQKDGERLTVTKIVEYGFTLY